ncbi:Spermatogenesis-associated protein 31E1 [Sciurus carolinensis]|uniref:Spermatogenesis-associated protein 31E1 n=1 Tax=Sciurus carolinensis TaxID=30640 RepID=A0AA41NBA3_SCICA|nr:Spermatogenesis-associated protein 31E1 [Sciurus carolinensis]
MWHVWLTLLVLVAMLVIVLLLMIEKRCRKKSRKKKGILKACRDCRKKVEETQQLALILQSHLRKFHDKVRFLQLLHEDAPGEVFKPRPVGAHQSPRQNVEDSSSATLSLLASLVPLTNNPLPLASSLSESKEDQSSLNTIPLGTVPEGSLSGNSYWASLITAISGLDCISYFILFFSWWWTTTKALFFSTWTYGKSQKEKHLSHHPPDPTLWGDPTHQQVEAKGLSFINPDVQKLLEMLITKRAELKMWKENAKNESSFKPMTPDHYLDSLGKMLKSLGGKRHTTAQRFWNTKGKPEQLPGSQNFSYHKALGDPLEHKRSQLFWGLPSLHSESLVATAWVPKRSSSARSKPVTFNEVSDSSLVQPQAEESPQISQDQPLPNCVAQPQCLTQTLPPSVAQVQNNTQLTSSLQNLPPSSPPQNRTHRTICPTSQEEVWPLIPTENQHVERPPQKQQKHRKVLPSSLQKSQEAKSQSTLKHHQGSRPSLIPKSAPILPGDSKSTKFHERSEQHRLERFITHEHQAGPPCRLPASQDFTQTQGKFPRKCCGCQTKDKHGHFLTAQPAELAYESRKGVQKVKSTCSGRFLKGPEQDIKRRDPEDLPWKSRSTPVKVLEGEKEDFESDLMRPGKCDSGSDLSTGLNKKLLEKILHDHLSKKLVQINEGIIPVYVRGSWLAANYTFPKSNTHKKHINLAFSKDQQSRVNTSQNLFFLDPGTHLMLETDIMRSRVRHRWSPQLQALDPMNHSFGERPPLPLPLSASPLDSCDSRANSISKVASFPEELPWKGPEEKVVKKMSVPTLQSPLPDPSPAERQKAWRGTPLGGSHEPSVVPPTNQEDHLPSQPHNYSLPGRTQNGRIIMGTARGSLKPSPSLAKARCEPWEERGGMVSGDPCCGTAMLEIKLQSQSSRSEETRRTEVEKEEPPKWEVTVSPLPAREMSDPPESYTEKRKHHFLQSLCPSKKGIGQEDSLEKVKPLSSTAQTQGSVISKVLTDNGTAKAQNIMTAVQQILVDKLGHQHGGGLPELN